MVKMDGAVSYCFWEICSKKEKYWSSILVVLKSSYRPVYVPGKIEKAVFTSVQVL